MSGLRRTITLVMTMAVILSLLVGTLSAGLATQGESNGGGVSTGRANNFDNYVCDQEADGNGVYQTWRSSSVVIGQTASDYNGANNGDCGHGQVKGDLYQHTVCEDRGTFGDVCGGTNREH